MDDGSTAGVFVDEKNKFEEGSASTSYLGALFVAGLVLYRKTLLPENENLWKRESSMLGSL